MIKDEIIEKLFKESEVFNLTVSGYFRTALKNTNGIMATYAASIRKDDSTDNVWSLGNFVVNLHGGSINKALSEFAKKCARCEGWFLHKDLADDETTGNDEGEYDGWCHECIAGVGILDPMTAAHNHKEDNKGD